MQLVSLKVICCGIVVREVNFKSGVNIITNTGDDGNQVGKSTALRAISFCLGSDGRDMWVDPETKKENIDVKNFILLEDVVFELNLKGSINHTLKRRTYEVQQKTRKIIKTEGWINGVHVESVGSYKTELAKSVFNYNQDSPSFNSIRSKFTRTNRLTSNNSLYYLDVHTSISEYTLIYSALFGFEGHAYLKKEMSIKSDVDKKKKRVDVLLNGKELIEVGNAIEDVDIQIEYYENSESEIDISSIQEKFMAELKDSRRGIASLTSEIASLETRLVYNDRTIEKYKENQVSIDVDKVGEIYREAIGYIPEVKRTLEDTIAFHNSIFAEKARQSEIRSKILHEELMLRKETLLDLIVKERKIIKDLTAEGQLASFVLIEKEIQSLREERGRLSYVFDEVKELGREVRDSELELQKTKEKIEFYINGLKKNIEKFNRYFSSLTRMLFKKHANSFNVIVDEKNNLRFSIVNSEKNSGDGAPRAEAMAFDISIVEYLKSVGTKLPCFTLQDYLESVDEEKLVSLLGYANTSGVQVVISILNDKLQLFSADFLKENTVLILSQKDKFFTL